MGASLGQLHSSQWAAGMAVVVFCLLLDPTVRNSFPLDPVFFAVYSSSRSVCIYIFFFLSVMWYTRAISVYSRKKFEVEFLSSGIPWQNRNFWIELRKARIGINGKLKYVRFFIYDTLGDFPRDSFEVRSSIVIVAFDFSFFFFLSLQWVFWIDLTEHFGEEIRSI